MAGETAELDYRALFEAGPGLLLVLLPDLTIAAVSDAYARATMTRREKIVGRGLFEVFPDNPDDLGATGVSNLRASLDRVRSNLVADTMAVQKYDIRRPEAEGGGFEERYWSPVNTPVLDARGRLTHIIHRVEDVTEFVRVRAMESEQQRLNDRLRSQVATMEAEVLARAQEISAANRELQRLNAELDRFFSLASDMFAVFNVDGTFRRVNAAWESILGWTPGELVGRRFIDLVHPDDLERTLDEFKRATDSGVTVTRFENRYRHKDGSYRWLDWTGRMMPGEQVHYSAARDVTDRRQTALALESARREAERASFAKSEFLSRMSHELRTPLNAVLGFAQLLELEALPPEQHESAIQIRRAGRHLLELINEVLDISRIEAGQMTISPEPVDVADLLDDVMALVGPLAGDRSVAMEASASGCEAHVLADRQRIRQVLINLVSNAVKYNRDGGAVTVSCLAVEGDRLRISVRDTGYGIPEDQLPRLFRPFERLGASAAGIEGTGMGLALSKGLMEAMGGTIGVTSELDQGTTFWVELALVEGAVEAYENGRAATTVPAALGTARTRKVLYIEDNVANLTLVRQILLHRPSIELITAMQGSLATELARAQQPDLVLLDLHLPDMPGDEILRRLRRYPETRTTPIVIVSADATKSQIARMTAEGAAGYLTKPLDVNDLLTLVDRLIGEG